MSIGAVTPTIISADGIKSVFISDCHLGSKTADTTKLLAFLEWIDHKNIDNLYIVGDFIDGWKLKRNWYWDNTCNLILRKIFSLLKHDTKVFLTPGNHDSFLRTFLSEFKHLDFAGLQIKDEFIYDSISHGKLLVVHGDKFDTAIRFATGIPLLITVCDISYDYLIHLNTFLNYFRYKLGLSPWSLSQAIKNHFKNAIKYIGNFESILSLYAKEKDCNGIVCGHIHKVCISQINESLYFNCGDWVESNTAIIEYRSGKIKIFRFEELTGSKSDL